MPSEFHQFVKLPTELRLKIWEYALRPISRTFPGAHFFSVPGYHEDEEIIKEFEVRCGLGRDCETEHDFEDRLTAPKFGSCHSWTNNNPSAYLWDFGMWRACYESRETIEKHYKTEYWTSKLRQDSRIDRVFYNSPVDVCIPFIYPRSDGDWRFSIHPNRDLVCLQPINVKNERFYKWYEYLTASCMVSKNRGLRGFANLAFEYDSSWYDGFEKIRDASDLFEEMSLRGLFIRALVSLEDKDLYAAETIWLIDYSLKRDKYGGHAVTKEGKVFNGLNRKFVQVNLDSHDYSGTWSRSALQFVNDLNELFVGENPRYTCLKHWEYESDHIDEGMCDYNIGGSVQVLACEEST